MNFMNFLGGCELHECPKCLRQDSIISGGLCDSCLKDLQCRHEWSDSDLTGGTYCLRCGVTAVTTVSILNVGTIV